MAENTIQTTNNTQVAEGRTPPVTRDEKRYQFPPVDIFETNGDLTVVADLPGVEKDGLNVRVDEDGVLTIEGRVHHINNRSNVLNEYDLVDYFRQFRLSEEIDREKISAELKHGVLTLKLPKAEAAKPRQIEVNVV